MGMKADVMVLVDDREKYPLLFPSSVTYYPWRDAREGVLVDVEVTSTTLSVGDYMLMNDRACIIERKGNLQELFHNVMTRDYKRFTSALDRLSEACEFPYLLLEETVAGLLTVAKDLECPEVVVDSFLREIALRNISLLLVGKTESIGGRTRLGEFALRILLSHLDFRKMC